MCAILVSDLENFTGAVHRLGDDAAADWIRRHDAILRAAIGEHGGVAVAHTGDGMIAAFPLASAALRAARDIVSTMADHSRVQPGAAMRARVGVHAGEPLEVDGRLFGSCVNVAVRVCERAMPGHVFVTNTIRQLVAGQRFAFVDRGQLTVAGLDWQPLLYELLCRSGGRLLAADCAHAHGVGTH
jgi:adenylate cyclase